MKPTWIIDTYLCDHAEYAPARAFPATIKRLGYPCVTAQYIPFSEDSEAFRLASSPAVVYGTHGFVKQSRKHAVISYCREEALKLSAWMPRYPADLLLNASGWWCPWAAVRAKPPAVNLFIRPDGVTKTFAGMVVAGSQWGREVERIDAMSGVGDQTWVFMAKPQEIIAEYRFFIVACGVVAGSQYRRNGVLDIRIDTSGPAQSLADQVAAAAWQPDNCYVVDVADTPTGPKIIEFNSLSCAGLYACDQEAIIHAVSVQVMRDTSDLGNESTDWE
jgi:ATP-grasp domain, R2K clade family 3